MAKRRPIVSVFLDSSVLFTAVNSPTGGSSKLFTYKNLKIFVSPLVLSEVEKNVRNKLQIYHLDRFFNLAEKTQILSQAPNNATINKARKAIVEKDAVILAEVKLAKMDLVTLDRRHFLTPTSKKFLAPKKILIPKELIEKLDKIQ